VAERGGNDAGCSSPGSTTRAGQRAGLPRPTASARSPDEGSGGGGASGGGRSPARASTRARAADALGGGACGNSNNDGEGAGGGIWLPRGLLECVFCYLLFELGLCGFSFDL
jgi:hypothetical protein